MNNTPRILVVDDEREIRELVASYLEKNALKVDVAATSSDAFDILQRNTINLAILDIMLGKEDGFELCRDIKKQYNIPIIFLSGKSDETERVIGLELGADDYVVKPFSQRELLARVRAVLRRFKTATEEAEAKQKQSMPITDMRFGPWKLDVVNQLLTHQNGKQISLSTGESRLLKALIDHSGEVLSRNELIELAHGRKAGLFDRSIDNYISRLRKKIEKDPSNPQYLKTRWGGGYSLVTEETVE